MWKSSLSSSGKGHKLVSWVIVFSMMSWFLSHCLVADFVPRLEAWSLFLVAVLRTCRPVVSYFHWRKPNVSFFASDGHIFRSWSKRCSPFSQESKCTNRFCLQASKICHKNKRLSFTSLFLIWIFDASVVISRWKLVVRKSALEGGNRHHFPQGLLLLCDKVILWIPYSFPLATLLGIPAGSSEKCIIWHSWLVNPRSGVRLYQRSNSWA